MIEAIIARLKDRVADLRNVEGASAFAAIMERNALPERTPAAYVVPEGERGDEPDASAGAYTQITHETISVVLILRPNDRLGARGIEPIESLRADVKRALAGWAPDDEIGVFRFTQGRMLNVRAGALAYAISFTITDQLRILS